MTMELTRCIVLIKIALFIAFFRKVDSSIGVWDVDMNTCEYKCKNGDVPNTDVTFRPKKWRCGLDHHQRRSRPEVEAPPTYMVQCCKRREECYYNCKTTLEECEDNFQRCVNEQCQQTDIDCIMSEILETYKSNCRSFIAAKRQACTCVPPDPNEPTPSEALGIQDPRKQKKDETADKTIDKPNNKAEEKPQGKFADKFEDKSENNPTNGDINIPKATTKINLADKPSDKPKFKVVERGTAENKQMYIMPEDEDEDEYIRKHPMPEPPANIPRPPGEKTTHDEL